MTPKALSGRSEIEIGLLSLFEIGGVILILLFSLLCLLNFLRLDGF